MKSDFLWGAASAAYQIEGASKADRKGRSVWDMFCEKPGATYRGHTGEVACDHYHRFREDVAVMKEIGLNAYRFSVAWTRVLPEGTGRVNERGVAFYDQLIDALLAAGIEPCLTAFHWDYPLALYQQGGWMNPKSVEWFAEYAGLLASRFGDRVKWWITQNEPQCFVGVGHSSGFQAPGDRLERGQVLRCVHHSLLAHGEAVQSIRTGARRPVKVGFSPTFGVRVPASNSSADIEAARKAYFSAGDLWSLSLWTDPVYLGTYPAQAREVFGNQMPNATEAEMALIRQPLDFFGCNVYRGDKTSAGPNGEVVSHEKAPGNPCGTLPWLELGEEAPYWAARFHAERYGALPFVVTENGFCGTDWVALDGGVHDPQRIDFMARYLRALKRASDEGYNVGGYFYWSLTDNFEWAEGYRPRFGLVHVDYQTQKRTIKDSGRWYREVIATNGGNLPG